MLRVAILTNDALPCCFAAMELLRHGLAWSLNDVVKVKVATCAGEKRQPRRVCVEEGPRRRRMSYVSGRTQVFGGRERRAFSLGGDERHSTTMRVMTGNMLEAAGGPWLATKAPRPEDSTQK